MHKDILHNHNTQYQNKKINNDTLLPPGYDTHTPECLLGFSSGVPDKEGISFRIMSCLGCYMSSGSFSIEQLFSFSLILTTSILLKLHTWYFMECPSIWFYMMFLIIKFILCILGRNITGRWLWNSYCFWSGGTELCRVLVSVMSILIWLTVKYQASSLSSY